MRIAIVLLLSLLLCSLRPILPFPASLPHNAASDAKKMSSIASGTSSAADLLTASLQAHKSGDYQAALEGYNSLLSLSLNPSTASAICSNAGAIFMAQGDYAVAKEYFEKGIMAQPDNPQSHFNLAVILTSKLGLHLEALQHLETAADLGYDAAKVNHLKGNALQDLGRTEEASQCYTIAESTATVAAADLNSASRPSPKPFSSSTATTIDEDMLASLRSKFGGIKIGDIIDGVESGGQIYSMRCLSTRPLLFYIKALVSESECEYITARARGSLQRSEIMGGSTKYISEDAATTASNQSDDPYRLSFNSWLPQDEVLLDIQARISALTGLNPVFMRQHSEELQVVRYPAGGRFKVHHDSSKFHPRLLTALFYLNTPPKYDNLAESGGTWFPFVSSDSTVDQLSSSTLYTVEEAITSALSLSPKSSRILDFDSFESERKTQQGAVIVPSKGDAVLFFNHLLDNSSFPLDVAAVHAGLPVRSTTFTGDDSATLSSSKEEYQDSLIEKWVANYWVTF